ncbi:MAG TPA: class I SAM-dependent methyltransferase, partial [Actinomycetota bacterium]|nr:class I SAM-dependent methyltransferase [Actinomycetota bacterium]
SCPFEEVEKEIPASGNILDVGCGHGLFVFLCALKSEGRSVTGIDVDKSKIEAARSVAGSAGRVSERVHFIVGGTIPNSTWDGISFIDVLYLLPDDTKESMVRAAASALTKNGVLVIKEIAKRPRLKYLWAFLQEIVSVKLLRLTAGRTVSFAEPEEIARWMKEEGLDVKTRRVDGGYLHPHHLIAGVR